MLASVHVNGVPLAKIVPHFCWVPERSVSQAKVRQAQQLVDFASARLGIPAVGVKWFDSLAAEDVDEAYRLHADAVWCDEDDPVGITDDRDISTIGLKISLEGDRLVSTVGHELQHVKQTLENRIWTMSKADKEGEATRVGEQVLGAWKTRDTHASLTATRPPAQHSFAGISFKAAAARPDGDRLRTYREGDGWAAEIDLGYPRRRMCRARTEAEARARLQAWLAADPPTPTGAK